MPTFAQQYIPPGAYVKFIKDQLSPTLAALARIPVIIGTGITSKSTQKAIVRSDVTADSLGLTGVTAITKVGNTDTTSDYVQGVDYTLGNGQTADKIVWATPGTQVNASYVVNDLDFGNFSSLITVSTNSGTIVSDSYVVELSAIGSGSTKSTLTGNNVITDSLTQTATLTITIAGTAYTVNLTSGQSRTQALAAINAAISAKGVATINNSTNLVITTIESGATQTITIAGTALLKQDLGLGDGTSDTFTYSLGVTGTGKVKITPRSTRVTTEYNAAQTAITAIPGLNLSIPTTSGGVLNQRVEIITTAAQIAKNPLEGATYYVTSTYTKAAADYELQYYTADDETVFYRTYGEPSLSNTLSLAAYVAFRNGVEILGAVQLNGGTGTTHFQTAIDKLLDQPIYYVVPITSNPLVHAYLKNHVENQSSTLNRRERVGLIGGSSTYQLFDHVDEAASINSERIRQLAPSTYTLTYKDTNNIEYTVDVDGSYAAVALAAQRSVNGDVAEPSTRKTVVGLVPKVKYNNTQMNQLSSKGVCVLAQDGAVLRVRHDLTTYQGGLIESKEGSLVEIKDYISQVCRNAVENEFPGTKILRATPRLIEQTTVLTLEGLVQQGVITEFRNVKASQNNVDPTQIDVIFEASPTYPFNYVLFQFNFLRRTIVA